MALTKTRSEVVPYTDKQHYSLSGDPDSGYPGYPSDIKYKSVTSSKTSRHGGNWRRKIALGQNATTVFDASKTTFLSVPAYSEDFGWTHPTSTNPIYSRKYATFWWGYLGIPSSLPSDNSVSIAQNIALINLWKSINQQVTLFQGGTALGELTETLHMIRHPAEALHKGMVSYLQAIRKRVKQTKPRLRKRIVRDSYLEVVFGWRPLFNDIADAVDYLDKRQNQLVRTFLPIKGNGTDVATSFASHYDLNGYVYIYSTIKSESKSQVRYKGMMKSTAVSPYTFNARQLGLSIENFLPTVWELIPYSFVVDYFTNIGTLIEAWSNQNVQIAWCQQTTRKISSQDVTGFYKKCTLQRIQHDLWIPGQGRATYESISRVPINDIPLPVIQFKIPGMGLKWLNLAALARTR